MHRGLVMQKITYFVGCLALIAACGSSESSGSLEATDASIDLAIDAQPAVDASAECEGETFACGDGCCLLEETTVAQGDALVLLRFAYDAAGLGTLLYRDGEIVQQWIGAGGDWSIVREPSADQFLGTYLSALVASPEGGLGMAMFRSGGLGGEVSLALRENGVWSNQIISEVVPNSTEDYIYAQPTLRYSEDDWTVFVRGARLGNGDITVDEWTHDGKAWGKRLRFNAGSLPFGVIYNALEFTEIDNKLFFVFINGTSFVRSLFNGESVLAEFHAETLAMAKEATLANPVLAFVARSERFNSQQSVFIQPLPFSEGPAVEISKEGFGAELRRKVEILGDARGNLHLCYQTFETENGSRKSRLRYLVQAEGEWTQQTLSENSVGGCKLGARPTGEVDIFYVDASTETSVLQHALAKRL